ncbi:rRNA-processing protein FCF1 homolog [Chironomus tepperi]|uniref:rRNA-processing protein FCF1 homolog n=1 Tax=Chironomus tepperi TaxID=113505 RepID=UPI00391FC8EA
MGNKKQKTRRVAVQKLAQLKRLVSLKDNRLKEKDRIIKQVKEDPTQLKVIEKPKSSSALFFSYNTQLGPPYHVILDTNFINFSIKNKLDILKSMMDCLYAKCIPYITECVRGELEKMGQKYKLALKIIKDDRFETLPCMHKGTYADDCIVNRVTQHKCYIVATNDKDLKRRIRKIPGVPIMSVSLNRYTIERIGDSFEPMSKRS